MCQFLKILFSVHRVAERGLFKALTIWQVMLTPLEMWSTFLMSCLHIVQKTTKVIMTTFGKLCEYMWQSLSVSLFIFSTILTHGFRPSLWTVFSLPFLLSGGEACQLQQGCGSWNQGDYWRVHLPEERGAVRDCTCVSVHLGGHRAAKVLRHPSIPHLICPHPITMTFGALNNIPISPPDLYAILC